MPNTAEIYADAWLAFEMLVDALFPKGSLPEQVQKFFSAVMIESVRDEYWKDIVVRGKSNDISGSEFLNATENLFLDSLDCKGIELSDKLAYAEHVKIIDRKSDFTQSRSRGIHMAALRSKAIGELKANHNYNNVLLRYLRDIRTALLKAWKESITTDQAEAKKSVSADHVEVTLFFALHKGLSLLNTAVNAVSAIQKINEAIKPFDDEINKLIREIKDLTLTEEALEQQKTSGHKIFRRRQFADEASKLQQKIEEMQTKIKEARINLTIKSRMKEGLTATQSLAKRLTKEGFTKFKADAITLVLTLLKKLKTNLTTRKAAANLAKADKIRDTEARSRSQSMSNVLHKSDEDLRRGYYLRLQLHNSEHTVTATARQVGSAEHPNSTPEYSNTDDIDHAKALSDSPSSTSPNDADRADQSPQSPSRLKFFDFAAISPARPARSGATPPSSTTAHAEPLTPSPTHAS